MRHLAALLLLLASAPAFGAIDPKVKAECMQAQDFVGCVKALGGGVDLEPDDGTQSLRDAMKQVAARLSSGTSLRDSTLTFQPVIDNLATAKEKAPESMAVIGAGKATELFDILQASWQARISSLSMMGSGPGSFTVYSCYATKEGVQSFNSVVGSEVVSFNVSGGLFGLRLGCRESVGTGHERMMMSFVIGLLKEASQDPKLAQKYRADRIEKIRLANMEAWDKHLDQNPTKKIWAAANPKMAAVEREKYNRKNPQQKVSIPTYEETLRYMRYFVKSNQANKSGDSTSGSFKPDCRKQPTKELFNKCMSGS